MFSHSELYHNGVPFSDRFIRFRLKGNLPGWYEMGRYGGWHSQRDIFGGSVLSGNLGIRSVQRCVG